MLLLLSKDVLANWLNREKTGRRGAYKTYSDIAIMMLGTMQALFHLARRLAEVFLQSLFRLVGVNLPVPNHTIVSRRLGKLEVEIPAKETGSSRHVVIDSTGVKVYGEGELKVRQHSWSKRRTWRKLHLGVEKQLVKYSLLTTAATT
jgi:hypothetical protein